ncbi:uncharacterized protein LOC121909344 isoform X3 [Thunnus maccoyii]|uniref:uncharacterized protein LOC121909344 isoform X3 n=1 Tax=Thunnus maccoyii TaxID=8240 RepID=UPI001C4BAE7B|nr:uncharacterized protein LOC121909344 isoform X3 [Thunnus maccoyii]
MQTQKDIFKMGKSCCAIDCTNRFNKESKLSFYGLPKAEEKRSKCIAAIRRNNWNPSTETWTCGSHFVSGKKSDDPLHPDYVPSLFSFTSTADRNQAVNQLARTKSLCGPGVNKEFDYLVPKKGHISLKCHAQFPSHDHLLAFWTLIEPATSRMVRTTRVSEAPADEGEEESFSRSTKLVPIDEFFLFLNYLSTGWSQRELGQCFNIYQTTVSAQLSSDNCSSQKSLCTFKAMVGMAPHGAVTFVSALYESLVSDKEISRQSGIIPLLSPDMAVMVDQRFLVDDLGSCKV